MGFLLKLMLFYGLYLVIKALLRGRISIHLHSVNTQNKTGPKVQTESTQFKRNGKGKEEMSDVVDVDYRVIHRD